jgi:hypothetical protein
MYCSPEGRWPDAARIPVPLVIAVTAGDWPDAAFERDGIRIWDSARVVVAEGAGLGDTARDAADWTATHTTGAAYKTGIGR